MCSLNRRRQAQRNCFDLVNILLFILMGTRIVLQVEKPLPPHGNIPRQKGTSSGGNAGWRRFNNGSWTVQNMAPDKSGLSKSDGDAHNIELEGGAFGVSDVQRRMTSIDLSLISMEEETRKGREIGVAIRRKL